MCAALYDAILLLKVLIFSARLRQALQSSFFVIPSASSISLFNLLKLLVQFPEPNSILHQPDANVNNFFSVFLTFFQFLLSCNKLFWYNIIKCKLERGLFFYERYFCQPIANRYGITQYETDRCG